MENRKLDWASRANEAVGVVNAQAGLDDKGEGGSRTEGYGWWRSVVACCAGACCDENGRVDSAFKEVCVVQV